MRRFCAPLAAAGGVLLWLAALALGQTPPPNVVRVYDGFRVKATWPEGAQLIQCETPGLAAAPVATLDTPEVAALGGPISVGALVIRCRACNTAGCSELSANAVWIEQRSRADCNGDGLVTVSDVVCVGRVIFSGE